MIELIPAKHDTEKESALRVLKQLRRGIKKMYRDYLVLKPAFKVSADSKFRMLKRINDSVSCVSDDDEADETYSTYNMLKLYKIGEDVENIVDMLSDVPVPTAEQRAAVKGVLVPSPLRKEELAEALPKPAEPAADAAAADAAAAATTSVSASSEMVPKKEEDEKAAKEKAAKKLRKEAKKDLQSDDEDDDDDDDDDEDDEDDEDDDEKEEESWYDQLDEIRSIVMRISKKHSKSMIFIAEMNDKKKSSEEKDDDMDDGEKEEKESESKEKEKPKKDTEGTATEGMKE